jgi:pyridoxal phosphate enzyme (YggS family)
MAAGGLIHVLERVATAARRVGRTSDDVTVVAVSKGRSPERIMELYEAGHRHFGENRDDELVDKAARLPDDIVWHFVGSVQSRKAKHIAPVATWVHSIDRDKLVRTFAALDDSVVARYLVQVNIAGEERKHGVAPATAAALVESAVAAGLPVAGLMVIPPLPEVAEGSRQWFAALVELRDRIATPGTPLEVLSMGMTDDYEVAIEEGATVVRVGRAIFDR